MSAEPPQLLEPVGVLMRILKAHGDKGRRKPKMMPSTLREAAEYWIAHQEPPDDRKEGVTQIMRNGELVGYETPYHNRLAYTLRKFLRLPEIYQVLVIEVVGRGFYWRGEEMDIFPKIVEQWDEMQKDPEAYKQRHQGLMRQLGARV